MTSTIRLLQDPGSTKVRLGRSRHGRGVFARIDFKAGDMIEVAPMLALSEGDAELTDQTMLADYVYVCEGVTLLAGGLGSFYNHSSRPNVAVEIDLDARVLSVSALTAIKAGSELRFDYSGDGTPLHFDR